MTIIKLETEKYKQIIEDVKLKKQNIRNLESQGVESIHLYKKKDNYSKEIKTLQTVFDKYGLVTDVKNESCFEIMMATYILPHNDESFLNSLKDNEKDLKEYQFLMPITVPEAGYDIYTFDLKTQKVLKETAEINVPMILDYRNVHFALPSKLNKAEKELLKTVIEKLKSINFNREYTTKLFAIERFVSSHKNKDESIRWNNITDIKFLAGRVFGPENIYDIKPKVKKKLKMKM